MFLLAYADVIVAAGMLYWLARLVSSKPSRLWVATGAFAAAFVFTNAYLQIILRVATGTIDDLSFLAGLVVRFVVAAIVGGVALYLLVMNEERLDNWVLTYAATLIVLVFL